WLLLLSKFDIQYVLQKSVKGRAIAEHLAECSTSQVDNINYQFPDEEILVVEKKMWKAYFDGALNRKGCGIGTCLETPEDVMIPVAVKLNFKATNNIAEYEACILALESALALGIEELEVYGDSALIICQTRGEWKTKDEKLLPYHDYLETLAKEFRQIKFFYLSRQKNKFADALATLASMADIPIEGGVAPMVIESREEPIYCCTLREGEPND
ncbi:ribonuclease HI family protein, partial [Modestobacter lapidis]|nr:ribonuclease HI family protein [Modestobacter lapidis]